MQRTTATACGVVLALVCGWTSVAGGQETQEKREDAVKQAPGQAADRAAERDQFVQERRSGSPAHVGVVVAAGDGELEMRFAGEQRTHTHRVAEEAAISLDGAEAKLEDLKPGDYVRVITKPGEFKTALEVTALREPYRRSERGRYFRERRQREGGKRGWLGVLLDNQPQERGALVVGVFPGSPAEQAGLRSGDAIVAINGQDVERAQEALEQFDQFRPGQAIKLTIERDGETQTKEIELEQRGGEEAAREDEITRIPEHVMLLEMYRRECQQRERLEGLLYRVLGEVQALRAEVEELKKDKATEEK